MQSVTLSEKSIPKPEVVNWAHCEVTYFTHQNLFRESANEDSLGLFEIGPECLVAAIADGAGGHPGGEIAAGIAIDGLKQQLAKMESSPSDASLRNAILDGIEQANQEILKQIPGAKTTLSVISVLGNQFRTYQTGDSGILACSESGDIIFKSISHSPVGFAVASGFMSEFEAMGHARSHEVDNFLGEIDHFVDFNSNLSLATGATLLVGSDGLFDNYLSKDLIKTIKRGPLAGIAQGLTENFFQQGSHPDPQRNFKFDDFSFVLLRLKQ
jgi:PPM family protein phosphatase